MVTSNLWVEAGLINGAQGTVKDIVFDTKDNEDSLPIYVLVCLDVYNGPSLFNDKDKADWVPIFPITRMHQRNRSIERTQIPLRLCSAMTGHKVQGLSLYKGVIVHNPTNEESKRDPMDIWGLNYCMLTRVPDISKIAFINLPDYQRHMKLYRKLKGKNCFDLFKRFDKKANSEFEVYVKMVGRKSLNYLKEAKNKLNLFMPINFYAIYQEDEQPHTSDLYQISLSVGDERQASTSYTLKERNIIQYPQEIYMQDDSIATGFEVLEKTHTGAVSMFSTFINPSNYCWFNSALQLIIHAIKNEGRVLDNDLPVDNPYHDTLLNMLKKFTIPGKYDVGSMVNDPTVEEHTNISLKHLMLNAMGIILHAELDNQQDASQCIQSLLEKIPQLNFLWHYSCEQVDCNGCDYTNPNNFATPVTAIEISNIRFEGGDEIFSAKDAIKRYFQSQEQVDRQCENCNATTCSKKIRLTNASNYIIIQFKRSSSKRQKVGASRPKKMNAISELFSVVDINILEKMEKYQVIATIAHKGEYLNSGHYISYILKNDIWYFCSDEEVRPLLKGHEDPTKDVYVLLLKKVNK